MGNAMKQLSYAWVGEDTVVPRAKLPELLRGVKAIGDKMNFKSLCFGHVGDGNLHINIISDVPVTAEWRKEMDKAKRAIFELTKSLGGMLSAEHGVGYTQKGFMDVFFAGNHMQILRGIKKVFDPRGILNPDKIFNTQ
jgi:glycolate oxidase